MRLSLRRGKDRLEWCYYTASSLRSRETGSVSRVPGLRCQDTILGDAEAQTRQQDSTQQKEIASLKKRVKKLERKRKSNTLGMNLFKIGTSSRRSLGEEDASKQERNLKQGKQSSIFEESDFDDEGFDADRFNMLDMEVNTASAPVTTAGVSVSTAEPITTASVNITTAEPITPPTTTTVFEDEDLTIAQTLIKMRELMMDADYELAARIQAQEQEELTIEEKSRLFMELMDKKKKHFARLRAEKKTINQSSKEESNVYLSEKHC
ncbi:hypothetical protein Tco_0640414 [Tanacetum coccineum]